MRFITGHTSVSCLQLLYFCSNYYFCRHRSSASEVQLYYTYAIPTKEINLCYTLKHYLRVNFLTCSIIHQESRIISVTQVQNEQLYKHYYID